MVFQTVISQELGTNTASWAIQRIPWDFNENSVLHSHFLQSDRPLLSFSQRRHQGYDVVAADALLKSTSKRYKHISPIINCHQFV